MAKILIIEDQAKLLVSLRRGLQAERYEVVSASDGDEGFARAIGDPVDLVVLDLMLPGRDGLSVLVDLRARGFTKPILILTARDAVEDRVRGLDSGANDYMVKPFALAELLARIRALLRDKGAERDLHPSAGDLTLDVISRKAERAGVGLELTNREFELLEYLLRHKDQAVTREMISHDAWGESASVVTNIVDVYIRSLRKKIERAGWTPLIHTVRRVGYMLKVGP
jgi:two-component system, OmpR family, copper resistance phosphate regulon response regulator CusR